MDHSIRLRTPAGDWMDAFLMGNGRIGGAVYGGVAQERIDLSEGTFFSGNVSDHNNQHNAYKAFYEMRRLVSIEQYAEAKKAADAFIGRRLNYGTNLPVGRMLIDFSPECIDTLSGYERTSHIMRGTVCVRYDHGDICIERETFVSKRENRLFYRIAVSDGAQIRCKIYFDGYGDAWSTAVEEGQYVFHASARETMHSDGTTGVNLAGCISVTRTDGRIAQDADGIVVEGASDIVLSLGMRTDYNGETSGAGDAVPITDSYEAIRDRHIHDFSSRMERVSFSLDGLDDQMEAMFQYGRYLLLSSSQEDSLSPAHLQGVWNDTVACRIGWTCDMHLDINTQMNYWLSLEGNLAECNIPLFNWTEEALIPSGRITARESYRLPGWVAELVSNLWGYSAPYWARDISPCPTGGVWLISQYWEYYLHTGDTEFLRDRAYPVIREAVGFFIEYIFRDGEYDSSGPSISPENTFKIGGDIYSFSNGSTYEILMIRELFDQFLTASRELDKRDPLVNRVEECISGLLPYRICDDGTLAEWRHPYPAADPQHRHTSHLLGLYPYCQITPEKTPELAKAARKSIEVKLTPYEHWEDTGWARSLLALYCARLGDGEGAYFHLNSMRDTLTSSSLLVMHPPTRGAASFKEVYELDGNTGFSMSVIEMLMQSHDGVIRLLPAIPPQWTQGHIRGLVARGNILVDIEWADSRLTRAVFASAKSQQIVVAYGSESRNIDLQKDNPYVLKPVC